MSTVSSSIMVVRGRLKRFFSETAKCERTVGRSHARTLLYTSGKGLGRLHKTGVRGLFCGPQNWYQLSNYQWYVVCTM